MKRDYLFFFLLAWGPLIPLYAQPTGCARLEISHELANPGDTVCFQITAHELADILRLECSLSWDTAVLEYQDHRVELPSGNGLHDSQASASPGALHLRWTNLTTSTQTLQSGDTLFQLRYLVKGNLGTEGLLVFHSAPGSRSLLVRGPDQVGDFVGVSGAVQIGQPVTGLRANPCLPQFTCTTPSVLLDPAISGGAPPYLFQWTDGSGQVLDNQAQLLLTTAGHYRVLVRDQNQRQLQVAFFLPRVRNDLTIDWSHRCPGPDSSLIRADLRQPPAAEYTFQWSNGQVQRDSFGGYLSDQAPQLFGVTVSDGNQCSQAFGPTFIDCSLSPIQDRASFRMATFRSDPSDYICLPIELECNMSKGYAQFSVAWENLDPARIRSIHFPQPFLGAIDSSLLAESKLGFRVQHTEPDSSHRGGTVQICFDGSGLDGSSVPFRFASQPLPLEISNQGRRTPYSYHDGEVLIDSQSTRNLIESNRILPTYYNCSDPLVELESIVSGGTPPYVHHWTGPNGFSASGAQLGRRQLPRGEYLLTVTDAGGETHRSRIVLRAPQPLLQGLALDHVSCAGGQNGGFEVFYNRDMTDSVAFQWTGDGRSGDQPRTPYLGAATYTFSIYDQKGCTSGPRSLRLHEPSPLSVDEQRLGCSGPGRANGTAFFEVSGGTFPYTYQWSDGQITDSHYRGDLSAGTYQLTISDRLNCALVLQNIDIVTGEDFAIQSDTLLCAGDSVDLILALPPGGIISSFSASDGSTCAPCIPPLRVAPAATTVYELTLEAGGCTYLGQVSIGVDPACVWPGDTDTNQVVNHFDLLNIGLAHGSNGSARPQASLDWRAQAGPAWNRSTPDGLIDYEHIDTNGDGWIDDRDTLAIHLNWGSMYNLVGSPGGGSDPGEQQGAGANLPFYVLADTLVEGEQYALPLILGEMDLPADSVYGLAFTLTYDVALVVPGSARVGFAGGWLGTEAELLYLQRSRPTDGAVDVAVTRRDQQNQSGFGAIGTFYITIEDDIFLRARGGDRQRVLELGIENVRLISAQREEIPTSPGTTRILLNQQTSTGIPTVDWPSSIEVFPNPVNSVLRLRSTGEPLERVRLYSAGGKLVFEALLQAQTFDQSCTDLPEGLYWLEVQTDTDTYTQKLSIIH
ncbi:MAG: T9SS type A sorting domain-containing protein [Bacteroidota bacterium]